MQAAPTNSANTAARRAALLLAVCLMPALAAALLCAGASAFVGRAGAHANAGQSGGNANRASEKPDGAGGQSNVRGRVVYADTGRPVRRAKVLLVRADAADSSEESGEMPTSPHAGTDRDGEFHFKNVEAGRYYVLVESPGVVSPLLLAATEADLVKGVASGRIRKDFAEVSADGLADARIDVRARRGGVIAGRAAYADGAPLANADVSLYRLRGAALTELSSHSQGVYKTLRTDGRGHYRVAGLPSGEYLVKVTEGSVEAGDGTKGDAGDAYTSGALVFAYHPDTPSLGGAKPVRVEEGREEADVNVVFPARPTRTLSGTVVSRRDNSPLAHARLTLEHDEEGYDDSMPTTSVGARTDEEGRWSIGGVPDGVYTLTASREPEYDETDEESDPLLEKVPSFVTFTRELKVEGDVRDMTITLGSGAHVSGTVVVEGRGSLPEELRFAAVPVDGGGASAATATTPDQKPSQQPSAPAPSPSPTPAPLLTREELSLVFEGDEEWVRYSYNGETGKFLIDSVPEGGVYLHVDLPPDYDYYVKSITRGRVDLLREPLPVKEGEDVSGVRVVLARGLATFAGRVLKAGGAGAGVEVEVVLLPVDPARRRARGATLSAQTGTDGRFEIHAPPGAYHVLAARAKEHLYLNVTEEDVRARSAAWPRVVLRPGERRSADVPLQEWK